MPTDPIDNQNPQGKQNPGAQFLDLKYVPERFQHLDPLHLSTRFRDNLRGGFGERLSVYGQSDFK